MEDEPIKKMSFGLGLEDIKVIENELTLWDEKSKDLQQERHWGKFSFYFWKITANKLGWCPHTLTLFYFRHLDKEAKEKEAANIKVCERLEDALNTCWASLNTYGEHIIIDKKVKNAIKLKNEQML
jgi:hypothetical protein